MDGSASLQDSDEFDAFNQRVRQIAKSIASEGESPNKHIRERTTNHGDELDKIQLEMTKLAEPGLVTYHDDQRRVQDLLFKVVQEFLNQLEQCVAKANLDSVRGVKKARFVRNQLNELSYLDSCDVFLVFIVVDSDTVWESKCFDDTVADILSKLSTNVFPTKFELNQADNVLSIRATMAADIVVVPNAGGMRPSSELSKVYLQTQRLYNRFHDDRTGWCKRFALLFRTVQLWAKRRHIRGGEYGYLSRHDILCAFEDFQENDSRPVLTVLETLLESLQLRANKCLFGDVIGSAIRDGITVVRGLNALIRSHQEFVRAHPFLWIAKTNLRTLPLKITASWQKFFTEAYWFKPNQRMLVMSTQNDALTRLHLLELLKKVSMIKNIGRLRPWNQPILKDVQEVVFMVSILDDVEDVEKLNRAICAVAAPCCHHVEVVTVEASHEVASNFGGKMWFHIVPLVYEAENLLRKASTIVSESRSCKTNEGDAQQKCFLRDLNTWLASLKKVTGKNNHSFQRTVQRTVKQHFPGPVADWIVRVVAKGELSPWDSLHDRSAVPMQNMQECIQVISRLGKLLPHRLQTPVRRLVTDLEARWKRSPKKALDFLRLTNALRAVEVNERLDNVRQALLV